MVDRDEPFPDPEDLDIYALLDWSRTEAPDWMRESGLSLETQARLDHEGVPPPDDWERAVVSFGNWDAGGDWDTIDAERGSDPEGHWAAWIYDEGGNEFLIDFGDDWVGFWMFYDYLDDYVDVENEVEY